jgi:hypothetical protein
MERDHSLNDLEDEQLLALFERVDAPAPPADFVAATMRAVLRAPVPSGRRALRDPLRAMFGWAAVIAAVGVAVFTFAFSHPLAAAGFSTLITRGVGTGVWLLQLTQTASRLFEVLATTGLAVSRAAVTTEGTAGLVLTAVMGGLSLSALYRVFMSEREDSQWREVS